MEDGIAYTLAMWRVREGREDEFVRAWKEDLARFFLDLPNPPLSGTLIRSVDDPRLFYSFGPWMSLEDIRRMRSNPQVAAVMGKLEVLCEEITPGNFQEVLTLP